MGNNMKTTSGRVCYMYVQQLFKMLFIVVPFNNLVDRRSSQMISSPLFSVIIEQKLDLATIITAVIAVLAWVFPFPDIGEKDKNNKDNQQEKAPKRNYYLKYRIIVFLICLAVLGVLSYKSNAGTGNPPASTLPPQETEIVSTPEITPEPTPEITPEPTPEITPEPTPEITPEPKNIIQQPQDLEVYPSDTAKFTVVASKAVKSYMWQYLKPGASWKNVTVSIFPSATTDTLTFIAHDSHNGFQYRCIVHFEDGTTEVSEPAKITVKSY